MRADAMCKRLRDKERSSQSSPRPPPDRHDSYLQSSLCRWLRRLIEAPCLRRSPIPGASRRFSSVVSKHKDYVIMHPLSVAHAALYVRIKRSTPKRFEVETIRKRRLAVFEDQGASDEPRKRTSKRGIVA